MVVFLGMFSINYTLTPFNYAVESWTISDSVFPEKSGPCAGARQAGVKLVNYKYNRAE